MRRVVFFIFFLFSSLSFAQSYSQLASDSIAKQHFLVLQGLEQLNREVAPYEVKILRKQIGLLKIFLDVFQFAYGPHDQKDLLMEIREELDNGYEVIGSFKDLNDTMASDQLDLSMVAARRQQALKWKEKFIEKNHQFAYADYLAKPLVNTIFRRSEKDLPKFFWRIVSFPEQKISEGREVLTFLLNSMLDISFKRYQKVIKLEGLFKHKQEEHFHDFRKLVRSHLKLVNIFFKEEAIRRSSNFEHYEKLVSLVDQLGDLHDLLMQLEATKSDKKRKKLKKRILSSWEELKSWCLENNIGQHLRGFQI